MNTTPAELPDKTKSAQDRRLTDFLTEAERAPYRFHLFSLLRKLEALGVTEQPLGKTAKSKSEKIRLKQEPSLFFAPAEVSHIGLGEKGITELSTYGFGLFGPNGPLPLHLTEYVYERKHHFRDHALTGFADIFHHRAISLFYRAWANAQSVNSLDGGDHWTFSRYIASLIHVGSEGLRKRDNVSDYAKYYFSGHLIEKSRPTSALVQILEFYFSIPVRVQQFCGRWIPLSDEFRARMSSFSTMSLGDAPVLGAKIFDIQTKFRLVLGPLNWSDYCSFFYNQKNAKRLCDWVNFYTQMELDWDVNLVLAQKEVPKLRLGAGLQLGLATWLGKLERDGDDLVIDLTRSR